jgi:hypothetical protein
LRAERVGASHLAIEQTQSTSVSTIVFRLMARMAAVPFAVSAMILRVVMCGPSAVGKIEAGVGKRLVRQGEMPRLLQAGDEASPAVRRARRRLPRTPNAE